MIYEVFLFIFYAFYIPLLSGFTVAVCGALKDCLHEKFEIKKFLRSPLICVVISIPTYVLLYPLSIPAYYLCMIAEERLITEVYKLYRKMRGKYVPGKFLHGEW